MKTKLIVVLILTITVISGLTLWNKIFKKIQYEEIQVKKGNISLSFRVNGTVEPKNRLPIKTQIAGRIEEILVQEGDKVKKGQIIAWVSSAERAALLDIAKIQGEQEYKKWQEVYKPTPITAPLDGFVIVRDKEPGQTITTADYIVVMADELIIKAYVDETDLRHIKLHQLVKCSLDAYPGIKFLGKVEHIAYESTLINNVTVYEVKIKPIFKKSNSNGSPRHEYRFKKNYVFKPEKNIVSILRSGMTATVEVVTQEKNEVLILPTSAVQNVGKEKFVLLKTTNKIVRQPIETGLSDGKNIEITSGLKEGDIVLIPKTSYGGSSSTKRQQRLNPMSVFFRR